MSLFAISDLHLSLGVDKPMDVFRGWENYVERLEENWKQLVGPEDTIVIAGDISWGLDLSETVEDFKWIDRMPGQKILLKGNHDLWFSTKSKVERFFQEQGFTTLKILFNNAYRYEDLVLCGTRGWMNDQTDKKVLNRECGRLRLSLEEGKKLGGTPVVFLHYPPIFQKYESPEILRLLKEHEVRLCCYGHIHGKGCAAAFNGWRGGTEYKLVSADWVDFTPVKIIE